MKASVLVVLLCVVGAGSDFYDFFDSVKVQFQNAWIVVKNFMKRPPRTKRPQGNVKKTTDQTKIPENVGSWWSSATERTTANEITTVQGLNMLYYFQRSRPKQVLLPIIPIPKWRTRSDWYRLQQPDLDFLLSKNEFLGNQNGRKDWNRGMNSFTFPTERDVTTKQLDEPADEEIGVMMFI